MPTPRSIDPKEEPEPEVPGDFTQAIYQAITKAFANKNPTQMFCLNWPGTVLDPRPAGLGGRGRNRGNMPETALIRSSVILDQYVPPAPITQPDGTRVSDRYKQAVSQLGPIPNGDLIHLQEIIRGRLQEKVKVEVNGTEKEMRLIDWFSYLYSRWIRAKEAWGKKQQEMMDRFKGSHPEKRNEWWNEYVLWYENNADGWIDKINMAYEELITQFR